MKKIIDSDSGSIDIDFGETIFGKIKAKLLKMNNKDIKLLVESTVISINSIFEYELNEIVNQKLIIAEKQNEETKKQNDNSVDSIEKYLDSQTLEQKPISSQRHITLSSKHGSESISNRSTKAETARSTTTSYVQEKTSKISQRMSKHLINCDYFNTEKIDVRNTVDLHKKSVELYNHCSAETTCYTRLKTITNTTTDFLCEEVPDVIPHSKIENIMECIVIYIFYISL